MGRQTEQTLGQARRAGQLVRVKCQHCQITRHFEPADLAKITGDVPFSALPRSMRCEKCGRRDYLTAALTIPAARSGIGFVFDGSSTCAMCGRSSGGRDLTRRTFAIELETAADQIADVSRADLQILLRRAALRLRNAPSLDLEADVDEAVDFMAAELKLPRSEVLQK